MILEILDMVVENKIPGGKGDKAKPSDFSLKQVLQGILVEMEHTDDEEKALEIALDHLSESKDYYSKLAKVQPEEDPTGVMRKEESVMEDRQMDGFLMEI